MAPLLPHTLHTLERGGVFRNLQRQMRFLHSCLYLTPETILSNIPRGGQWAWATHVLCKVPALLGNVRFCTWRRLPCFNPLVASLQGGISDSACVLLFILPLKEDDISVYRRCLCQVQLVGLVCLLPFFSFSLLCSWSQWPNGKMPSSPEGHYTATSTSTSTNMTQLFFVFKHHQKNAALTISRLLSLKLHTQWKGTLNVSNGTQTGRWCINVQNLHVCVQTLGVYRVTRPEIGRAKASCFSGGSVGQRQKKQPCVRPMLVHLFCGRLNV